MSLTLSGRIVRSCGHLHRKCRRQPREDFRFVSLVHNEHKCYSSRTVDKWTRDRPLCDSIAGPILSLSRSLIFLRFYECLHNMRQLWVFLCSSATELHRWSSAESTRRRSNLAKPTWTSLCRVIHMKFMRWPFRFVFSFPSLLSSSSSLGKIARRHTMKVHRIGNDQRTKCVSLFFLFGR